MRLAQDIGRAKDDPKMTLKRESQGPFGGMNQTEARIGGRIPPKVRAAVERSAAKAAKSTADARRKNEKKEKPLTHALKMQATLTPLSYNHRAALKEKLEDIKSFDEFELLPSVRDAIYTQALAGMTEVEPTPAQKLAIPALLSKKKKPEGKKKQDDKPQYAQFLIAAETGSGKTLAYLVPVIDAIKRQEELELAEDDSKQHQDEKGQESNDRVLELDTPPAADSLQLKAGRPRAIILLPSSELVSQVGRVVKSMSHSVKFKSHFISSAQTPTVIRNRLFNPNGIDIVVSTPHLIASIAEKEPNILSRVTHLVVDEADSLFDRSFAPITSAILDRAAPSLKQLILCSATIPRSLDTLMDRRFPEIKRLVTPKLHTIPRRVQLGVVDVDKDPFRGSKNLACANVIWQIGRSVHEDSEPHHTVKSILVFVNEREQADEVAQYLISKGIEAVPLTRDTPEQRQSDILSAFTSWDRVRGEEKDDRERNPATRSFRDFVPFDNIPDEAGQSKRTQSKRLSNVRVLVTTDLASRGLDTMSTRFVILHGIPHTTIDFIHRIGRLGRMGRRGRAIALVDRHDRKDVVAEVRRLAFRGMPLI